jgi:D-tyrosyl-tRNA(Tyr) deacylase
MRVLLQRVSLASVSREGKEIAAIKQGYLLFLCVMQGDSEEEAQWLAGKVSKLRLYPGQDGTVNMRSIVDVSGEALVLSQFTLAARTEKGNRPDYTKASPPDTAEKLYKIFIQALREAGIRSVKQGVFGAMMQVHLTNDGPVTLLLEKSPN